MLHEKIQSTIGLIDDVIDNRQKDSDNANTAKRNNIFFDSLAKLTPSVTSFILAKKNFGFSLQSNTAAGLHDLMNYAKTTFTNEKAVNPVPFKQKVDAFVEAIAKEWEIFCKANNSELINGLNIIVLVHPTPIIVRSCITAFNKCEKWPLTQESIDSYFDAKTIAEKLLKEMKFDEEIKDFLIKVRNKTATLSDLSESIMQWIKNENISDKVTLGIRNVNS